MKQTKRPQVNDLVVVEFYDHAENSRDALLFECIGRIFDITKLAYKLRVWGYVHDVDRAGDGNTDNEHHFSIVKKAIKSIRVLKC